MARISCLVLAVYISSIPALHASEVIHTGEKKGDSADSEKGKRAPLEADSAKPGNPTAKRTLACTKYRPGDFLTASDRHRLTDDVLYGKVWGDKATPKDKLDGIAEFNRPQDAELTAAALELFTNPATQVRIGPYTAVEAREKGKYRDYGSKDGGAGLRVMFQLEVPGPNGEGDKRLISAITFWKLNPETKKMEMLTGKDSFRIRAEIVPHISKAKEKAEAIYKDDWPGWIGVSYQLEADKKGKVTSLAPMTYHDKEGKEDKDPRVGIGPQTCVNCHGNKRNMWESTADHKKPKIVPNVDETADACSKNKESFKAMDAIKATFADERENGGIDFFNQFSMKKASCREIGDLLKGFAPEKRKETFFPKGLVDILRSKCSGYQKDEALKKQLASYLQKTGG